jgi:hypothetical protein
LELLPKDLFVCSVDLCRFEEFLFGYEFGSGYGSSQCPSTRESVADESEGVEHVKNKSRFNL